METMYAKSFEETISALTMRRIQLADEEKELFCNVAKAFVEKYGTNFIEFDRGNERPCLTLSRVDEEDADCAVNSFIFNEKGEIESVSGETYYDGESVYDEPLDSFFGIDYLDLASYITFQINNGQYVRDDIEED